MSDSCRGRGVAEAELGGGEGNGGRGEKGHEDGE